MSDLINGREMLKRYQVDLCYGIACKECSMCTEDGGCRVEEWIDKFPSADRPQEWIPCSERLPRPYTEVLVCDECGWISMGSYRPCDVTEKDSGWSTLTRIKIPTDGIIAWMPLPEPWKGADDE